MERKLYKTKLCMLFERGRCSRMSCSFAHGEAELRRMPMSGRRDFRSDLRDRLDRRHSPYRRYSPGRDIRGRPAFYGQKQAPRDRGYSHSRSPVRRSERRHVKKQHPDGQSDDSRSPKFSDDDNQPKERRVYSDDDKDDLGEKLKELQSEIDHLDENKHQLEMDLREKDEEADKLKFFIQDLESQLNQEKDDCQRLISRNKKFIKVLGRYTRAQDELKRSQSRLQKLANQFSGDGLKSGANDEDSSINIISDGELNHNGGRQDTDNRASPRRKRARLSTGSSKNKERLFEAISDKPVQSENNRKEHDLTNILVMKNEMRKMVADDQTQRVGKVNLSSGFDKGNVLERGNPLPPTSIAAHAVDDLVEAVETDDRSEAAEAGMIQNGIGEGKLGLLYLPPLPPKVVANAYNQYEDDNDDDDEIDVVNDKDVGNEENADMNDE